MVDPSGTKIDALYTKIQKESMYPGDGILLSGERISVQI
jgi:hypothetical protein